MSHVGSVGPNHVTGNVTLADMALASGTATLNGTTEVSVALASLTAAHSILVAHKTPAGTPGAPYVSSKTASTGFGLKSSASDTSVVTWYVL
jgi:hypothetical protein